MLYSLVSNFDVDWGVEGVKGRGSSKKGHDPAVSNRIIRSCIEDKSELLKNGSDYWLWKLLPRLLHWEASQCVRTHVVCVYVCMWVYVCVFATSLLFLRKLGVAGLHAEGQEAPANHQKLQVRRRVRCLGLRNSETCWNNLLQLANICTSNGKGRNESVVT
jgi:hypothetical protein